MPVRSICIDGATVSFVDAWLSVTVDRSDFELRFTAQAQGLGTVVELEVCLTDGRTLRAQGVDAEPGRWTHHYVNGIGLPRWATG